MKTRFTRRTGGVSHGAFASLNLGLHVGDVDGDVLRNRDIAAASLNPVQYMNQVHGDRIAIIEEVTDEAPTADALVTGIPGIALAVMVADCIPLLLAAEQCVAVVHVGRRGLMNGITTKTLSLMREMGAEKITAIVGPSICGKCYEVSEDIYQEVVTAHPLAASSTALGTRSLDLPGALEAVLQDEQLSIINKFECTLESDDLFSYRRDGVTGRQAGIIQL
jgi:YfiH family protein